MVALETRVVAVAPVVLLVPETLGAWTLVALETLALVELVVITTTTEALMPTVVAVVADRATMPSVALVVLLVVEEEPAKTMVLLEPLDKFV